MYYDGYGWVGVQCFVSRRRIVVEVIGSTIIKNSMPECSALELIGDGEGLDLRSF